MNLRRVILLGLVALLLASCDVPLPSILPSAATQGPGESPAQPTQTVPLVTPTLPPRTLTVCTGGEPSDLYLYNEMTDLKKAVLAAIYDGPMDPLNFSHLPVVLIKLPSLADGDAVIESVTIQEGDRVMDDSGVLSALASGVRVRPAGCRSSGCAVAYAGSPLTVDRLRVTFHLRPGVEWADGAPLTAADSVFSYRVAVDASTLYGNNGLISASPQSVTFTASYMALDDLTVEWTGVPGFLDPNYQTDFFIPLPEHQLGSYDVTQLALANEVLYAPLGWGPYSMASWQQGRQMVLQPNAHYFRRAEGKPSFDQLVFRFVGRDEAANLASLADGSCDLLLPDALPETPSQAMLSLAGSGSARATADLGPAFEQLTFNVTPPDPAVLPFFADVRMRAAVAACIDRGSIAAALHGGLLVPIDGPLPSDHPLMAGADLPSHPFDPASAGALLAAAGWTDADSDGILEALGVQGIPDGTPLRFALTTTDAPMRTQVSGLIAAQLGACRMDVSVQQAPARDLLAQNGDARLAGRRFDMAELSSQMSVEYLCAMAVTTQISSDANGWTGTNLSGVSDPAIDAACAAVAATLPGSADYATSRQTALRLFSEQLLVLPLFSYARFTLARPDLSGLMTGFDMWSILQNIEDLRLEP